MCRIQFSPVGKRARLIIAIGLMVSIAVVLGGKNAVAYEDGSQQSYHFVLVHGAWHGAWCWYKLKTLLESEGHIVTTLDLPSHGIDKTLPETVTLQDYADRVIDLLETINGRVILVGHSMGGIVISKVADALPSKIDKLVYLAAFLIPSGTDPYGNPYSLLYFGSLDENSVLNQPGAFIFYDLNEDGFYDTVDVDRNVVEDAFYGESEDEDVTLSKLLLVPNPFSPIVEPMIFSDQRRLDKVQRYYISTTEDRAITPWLQELMYTLTPVEAVYTIDSDHAPFFSEPNELKDILLDIASD